MQENLNEEVMQAETENVETAENTENCEKATCGTDTAKAEDTQEAVSEETAEENFAENETEEGSEEEKEGKGFFGKKKDKKVAALEEKVAELEDRTKRQMAEFENFRKRTEKEKSPRLANLNAPKMGLTWLLRHQRRNSRFPPFAVSSVA